MFPPLRWRLARLISIQGWRSSSQSSMASISLPVTAPSLSRVPRLVDAVSGSSALAVASLEAGSRIRAATAASARSRLRSFLRPRRRLKPSRLIVPSTAAAWPCGRARRIAKALRGSSRTTPPLSTARNPSTTAGSRSERLATVLWRTRRPSHHVLLRRTALVPYWLGITSIRMDILLM